MAPDRYSSPAHRLLSLLCAATLLAFAIGGAPARAGIQPTPFLVFDVLQATASGPAYPTQPVQIDVGAPQFPPDPIIPVEILALSLRSVDTVLPINLGATPGPTNHEVTIDFMLGAIPVPNDGLPAVFDLLFDLHQHPDSGASAVMGVDPTPFIPADSFFDVFFEISLEDIGTVKHTAHFETLQPLAFSGVNVTSPQSPAFGTSFSLDPVVGANLDPAVPLFSVTLTGSFEPVPEPGTFALLGIGLAGLAARRWRQ